MATRKLSANGGARCSVRHLLVQQTGIGENHGSSFTSPFGLLVIADKASPQSHNFYGYMRVQNPQGISFSVEGFPLEDFSNQVSDAIGLMKQAAAPGYQTNCFVGSLEQPVSYSVKLFNGFSGSQIGSTVTGSLTAFQQIRYLDIFGSNGVNAPAGDQFNVRAEFTQTSGGTANLIGFCTVQDNTSFGADFRVAKSYGSPSGSFFAQGGNAFGTTATLGTTDASPLHIIVNGGRVMRYEQTYNIAQRHRRVRIQRRHTGRGRRDDRRRRCKWRYLRGLWVSVALFLSQCRDWRLWEHWRDGLANRGRC